jgi:serine/threonine-protein kinase
MQGKKIFGRYEIFELLGEGGMARVYRARDLHLGREVAVKVLLDSVASDPDLCERFRREARAAATLSHPNIVGVFDFLESPEGIFLIMELVRGEDLRTRLNRSGPLPVPEALRIAGGILTALQEAHRHGLIHRDISARNVLLDESGTVRVSDFGIARAVGDRTLTRTGEMLGSVQYISPEQARGDQTGAPADLYAVGVLLYEMLTGRLPFVAENPVQLALKHINEEPAPPSDLRPGVPEDLEDLVLQALSKDPEGRFPSAGDMLAALQRVGSGDRMDRTLTRVQPVPGSAGTRPPQVADGSSRPAPPRRAGLLWLMVGTALVALLAGVVWSVLRPVEHVEVPNLVGLSLVEARRQAASLGLDLRIQDQRPSEEVPPETILEQRPAPGQRLAKGSALYVIVCSGREMVTVPDLTGLTLSRAREELSRLGLVLEESRAPDSQVPPGVVIRQSPAPGGQVTRGTTVVAVVSSGPGTKELPDLRGMPRAEAEKVLADLGFELVVRGTRPNASVAVDSILEQTPSPGTLLDAGKKVYVVLSLGQQGLVAPDLVGKSLREAREIAARQGLTLVVEGATNPEDAVESQNPAPGQPLSGAEIHVASHQTAVVPRLQGSTVEEAKERLEALGLQVGEVFRVPSEDFAPGEIIEQSPAQGIEAPRGSTVDLTVADPAAPTPVVTPTGPEPGEPAPSASWVP